MNPSILAFPTLSANPSKVDWKMNRMDATFISPLSGVRQDIARPGAYWSVDMSWNVLSYADSQLLQAWAVQMSRAGFRTQLPNYAYTLQGSAPGTPTINGTSQTGTSLLTTGWTVSSSNVLKTGDLFNVYYGNVTFVVAPGNTYPITYHDFYGNSVSIGTGNGSTTSFALPNGFFTGYGIYVNGVLQTYTTDYTTSMGHQLLMATANANSDSSGNATIQIEPALRFSPRNTSSVITTNPTAVFAFSKPSASISYTAPRLSSLSISLAEDINL